VRVWRGLLVKSVRALPPAMDSSSKASPDGEAEGHSDHWCELGRSP